ncbi:MAG TPA: glycosyltransferase family protein [Candidatus Paceibacterota bacterium]
MTKVLCIIQARMGSTRLPGKIIKEIKSRPLLSYVIDRVKRSKKIDKIIVATTNLPEDDATEALCLKEGIDCYRGSVNDVLGRYYEAAKKYPEYEAVVRVTGDCPLIDPKVIDQIIDLYQKGEFDYAANILKETYPDGMDAEVFSKGVLEKAFKKAKLQSEREHVTLFIRNNPEFKKGNIESKTDYSKFRFTVDNPEDFEVMKFIIENTPPDFGYEDYVRFVEAHPEILEKNLHIKRNEGLAKSLKNDKVVKQ